MDINDFKAPAYFCPHNKEAINGEAVHLSYDEEYVRKINAIDLIIKVLTSHEKNLDALLSKLEAIIETRESEAIKEKHEFSESLHYEPRVLQFSHWIDFKERSRGARPVSFKVENNAFMVDSEVDGENYRYIENLKAPKVQLAIHIKGYEEEYVDNTGNIAGVFKRTLKCGLQASIKTLTFSSQKGEEILLMIYEIAPQRVKRWLSRELRIHEEEITAGKLLL
jgi:hypothetical protein